MIIKYVIVIVLGYLLGGILFSYDLPKMLKHKDITAGTDDGNPGAANAFKNAGIPMGILCVCCDVLKGFIPVFAAMRILDSNYIAFALVIIAPVLGHAVAPFYRIRGGKAIAVSFGVLLGLLPYSPAVYVLAFWYILLSAVFNVKPNSRCSKIAFMLFDATVLFGVCFTGKISFAAGCILVSVVVIYKHSEYELGKIREEQPESEKVLL